MLIECLDILSPRDIFKFKRFGEIAAEAGADLRVFQAGDGVESQTATWNAAIDMMNHAEAFFIPASTFFLVPALIAKLHERVAGGCRILIQAARYDQDQANGFLARYDLTVTNIRIDGGNSTLPIGRTPHTFRDESLLAGVDVVVAQQAMAIWCGGESTPVLVAEGNQQGINTEVDLPSEFQAKELACIGAWRGSNGGAVVLIAAGFLYDPYIGSTGIKWPGISVNEKLASNLVRFLIGKSKVA
jgi:hypothetical protein